MTDWSKLKVAELKDECKLRDISITGLRLKQQYINKLEEHEAAHQVHGAPYGTPAPINDESEADAVKPSAQPTNGDAAHEAEQLEVVEREDEIAAEEANRDSNGSAVGEDAEETSGAPETRNGDASPKVEEPRVIEQLDGEAAEDVSRGVEVKVDAEPAEEENNAPRVESHPGPTSELQAPKPTEGAEQAPAPSTNDKTADVEMTSPEPIPDSQPASSTQQKGDQQSTPTTPAPVNSTIQSKISTPGSTQIPPAEIAEDQRKRKRRSTTPVPTAEEVALKKAKTNGGSPVVTDRGASALQQVQEATDASQALREADGLAGDGAEQSVQQLGEVAPVAYQPFESTQPTGPAAVATTLLVREDSPEKHAATSENEDSPGEASVAPALHPATSSLYIRNFKRPLHIPTLKEHIVRLATRSEPDSAIVKTFYLDSIRTHAFISFSSMAAAARVRTAMHETRYPDEPQREPLFVDYIPDDKVQEWIDRETGGGFGRGGNNRRFEVVYNVGPNGMTASLEDADASRQRPSMSIPQRPSISNAPRAPAATGVHPDRAAFVPRAERKPSSYEQPPKREAGETGFKALDELFSSTTAKPKLYYKPAVPEVVDDRLDLMRGLRVGHSDMGRSGDEGMKRYTFEKYKGREDWVDKGPEFGHGSRGQAMLRGGRGRGGGSRGGRGDSWRGR